VRVSKLMSERLCPRREADEYRADRCSSTVRVTELGTRIEREQVITLATAAKTEQAGRVTLLLHKPLGYVSGQAEDGYQPASVLITAATHWPDPRAPRVFSPAHLRGLAPAGRLDIDSTGLIVFTQDGRIAKELVGEDSRIEKEYLVRVEGRLSREGLALLNFGLALDGLPLKPAKVSWQNEDQLRFVLRQGRKRQIRRMCELVGLSDGPEARAHRQCAAGSLPVASGGICAPTSTSVRRAKRRTSVRPRGARRSRARAACREQGAPPGEGGT
jgi:23S rRNA pseudouridine2604 synthase